MEKEYITNKSEFVRKILGWFYHLNYVYSTNIIEISKWKYEVLFSFLPYKKVIKQLWHVSANQIHEAIMEWMYLVLWKYIESWNIEWVLLEDFLELRATALYREVEIKFKKEIQWNQEINKLYFEICWVKNIKNKFNTFEIKFRWFCEWKAKSVISINEAINKII